ncbi:MAG: TonB-dependent receptor [Bacteroidales bacterium]
MKRTLFIIVFFLFFISSYLGAQEKLELTWNYTGQSFRELVSSAESRFHLKFFYKDEWVKDLKPSEYPGLTDLRELLDRLFQGQSLFYFIDESGNVVITKYFAVKIPGVSDVTAQNYLSPTEYYDSKENQQLSGNIVREIGNPEDKYKPGNVLVTGYITNKDTKEPVAGVTVFVQKLLKGTTTNEYGFYSISLPRGNLQLQYSFIGMREKQVSVNLYGAGELNVEMTSVLIPLKETVVTAQKSVTLQRFEVGLEKINVTSFKLMPTSMGEADILKNMLLVPGVQSVGEGSQGFNVRGGSADQNLVLLNGAPVYNTSHFFGFFSAVNSDIIKDVSLYKGGIPSRYGGRISSVLDIIPREGSRKEFSGNAGISPITTHLKLEGPIIKDTLTYIITGRTTYSNWVLGLLDNPSLKNSSASFYDLNARITYDPDRNNKFDLSGYVSSDAFKFNSDTLYSYNNAVFSAKWKHFFTSRFFSVFSLNNSDYKYNVSSTRPLTEGFLLSHRINSTGLKADFNWYPGTHEFNFGAEINRYMVLPGSFEPKGDSSLVIKDIIDRERAVESSIYFEDKLMLTDNLSLNAGIRLSTFMALGGRDLMIYDSALPRTISAISDTISYKRGEIMKFYGGPEFRISLNWKLSPKNSLKLNYNKTRQYLHLLSNSTSISPTDTWKLSDYYLKPQVGDQYAAGFYHVLSNRGIETSVEVYFKQIKNMVDFKGGTNLIMDRNVEKDLVNVKGLAYGTELMLKKTEGKLRWSLAYTFSRVKLRSNGKFPDEIINSGNWFPANFDKPNDLVATMNYLFSRRFTFSANYTYSTGRPITYPVTIYYLNGVLITHYSERNKYRIPDYSRFDISWTISGNLKARKLAHPNWVFSVYNLFSRPNVYSIYFRNEGNQINGYKLSVFGRAIPSVTFNFDF